VLIVYKLYYNISLGWFIGILRRVLLNPVVFVCGGADVVVSVTSIFDFIIKCYILFRFEFKATLKNHILLSVFAWVLVG